MRHGEEETSAILRRAAELQARRSFQSPGAESGLTLAEIEQAAADVGIRPEFIRAAVSEQQVGSQVRLVPAGMWEVRRDVAGAITETAWREMVDVLQQSYGKVGLVSRTGDTFEWQLKSDPDPHTRPSVHVTIHSRPNGAEIVLRSAEKAASTRGWIIGTIASPILSFLLTIFLSITVDRYMQADRAWTLMTFFTACSMLGTGFAIKSWLRKDRRKLAGVADLLGYVARGAAVVEEPYTTLPTANLEPQTTLTLGRSG